MGQLRAVVLPLLLRYSEEQKRAGAEGEGGMAARGEGAVENLPPLQTALL